MKNFMSFILLLVLCFSFANCSEFLATKKKVSYTSKCENSYKKMSMYEDQSKYFIKVLKESDNKIDEFRKESDIYNKDDVRVLEMSCNLYDEYIANAPAPKNQSESTVTAAAALEADKKCACDHYLAVKKVEDERELERQKRQEERDRKAQLRKEESEKREQEWQAAQARQEKFEQSAMGIQYYACVVQLQKQEAQADIKREKKVGRVSGMVNTTKLHKAGEVIVSSNEYIAKCKKAYKRVAKKNLSVARCEQKMKKIEDKLDFAPRR